MTYRPSAGSIFLAERRGGSPVVSTRHWPLLLLLALVSLLRSQPAWGQAPPPEPDFELFYYFVPEGDVQPISAGETIKFPNTVAQESKSPVLILSNRGKGSGNVNAIDLVGANFQLSDVPTLPVTLSTGQEVRFTITFTPPSLGLWFGFLSLTLDDEPPLSISLEGQSTAPQFQISYVDPRTGSRIALANGSTLPFPDTSVGSSTTISVIIANRGSDTSSVNAITLGGTDLSAFELLDLPLFPASVGVNAELRFRVRFSPEEQRSYAATLGIELPGRFVSINLTGAGVGADFVYEVVRGEEVSSVGPEGLIELPDANVGESTSVVLRIRNQGTASGQLTSIEILGSAFQVTDRPFLPVTIPVDGVQHFTLKFTPSETGVLTGRLRLGSDRFDLQGRGLGPRLEYSFSDAAATIPVEEGQVVVLSQVAVGDRSSGEFAIENKGTVGVSLASVSLAPVTEVFLLEGLPQFPLGLEPGGVVRFSVIFAPNRLGLVTARLFVNDSTFTVTGTGLEPVPLPPYRFDGASGVQDPLQQPSVALTLAEPYSLLLRGTLTLTFVSNVFGPNPAAQFATGGTTASFTIAANSTEARFDNNATSIRLQTGTVAGNIVLKPAFFTEAGLDLTPTSPQELILTINSSAPRLMDIGVYSRTQTGFVLAITGYTTTRFLRQLDFQVTPRSGEELTTTHLSANVESASLLWFQSEESFSFGGLFTVFVPFFLGGDHTQDQVQRVQSVTATTTNEIGASNSLSVEIR